MRENISIPGLLSCLKPVSTDYLLNLIFSKVFQRIDKDVRIGWSKGYLGKVLIQRPKALLLEGHRTP